MDSDSQSFELKPRIKIKKKVKKNQKLSQSVNVQNELDLMK